MAGFTTDKREIQYLDQTCKDLENVAAKNDGYVRITLSNGDAVIGFLQGCEREINAGKHLGTVTLFLDDEGTGCSFDRLQITSIEAP